MVFPANDDAAIVMQPSEQTLDFPTTPIAPKRTAVLRWFSAARGIVWCDQFYPEALADFGIKRIAVVRPVADHSLGRFGEEALLERGADELRFMRRSAGHVHGERKTMAVADRHDFAAFAALCRADTRAPFFAPLKLASMKDSLRSSFPRSRKSSASFCSKRVSSPLRCQDWNRR